MKLFRGFHFFKEFLSRHVTCKPIHGYLYPIIFYPIIHSKGI